MAMIQTLFLAIKRFSMKHRLELRHGTPEDLVLAGLLDAGLRESVFEWSIQTVSGKILKNNKASSNGNMLPFAANASEALLLANSDVNKFYMAEAFVLPSDPLAQTIEDEIQMVLNLPKDPELERDIWNRVGSLSYRMPRKSFDEYLTLCFTNAFIEPKMAWQMLVRHNPLLAVRVYETEYDPYNKSYETLYVATNWLKDNWEWPNEK